MLWEDPKSVETNGDGYHAKNKASKLSCKPGVFEMLRRVLFFLCLLATLAVSQTSNAETKAESSDLGPKLGPEKVQYIQTGIRITAGGRVTGIYATVPIPMDWPEQSVKVIDEDISPNVKKVDYRILENSVRQMLVSIPRLNPGDKAHALLKLEVRGNAILPPKETTELTIPKRLAKANRKFVGASPFIESRNRRIQNAAREAVADKETPWEKAEAIYDYVREKVQYQESELKGAVQTLQDGVGDCEAMTSLFIAMCRGQKIPARMVWVTDHCYPEFFLQDSSGEQHWYPCQVAGTRAFGSMPDVRPILQKGDNIRIPEKKKGERYASVFLRAKSVKGSPPRIEEVLEFTTEN